MSAAIYAKAITTVVLGVQLTGCMSTLAPKYDRPVAPVSQTWPEQKVGSAEQTSGTPTLADVTWQTLFADAKLQRVVQLALENNRDLRVAALNIEKARAQYRIQRSELAPNIGAGLSGNSGRTPGSISTTGNAYTGHAYDLSVGVTAWELDLFGRIRSLKDQALQQYLSTEAAQRATRISLIAEVVSAYLRLSATSEQLKVAQDTEQSRQRAYDLQRQLREIGNASELELQQAQSELQAARDDKLVFDGTLATERNALELLVGTPLPADLQPTASLESILTTQDLPPGLPADVLQRRPDILAAEHALIAAHANIGAARAAFFPRISLTAGIGRASDSLDSLFDGGNRAWSFLPQISIPIFTGGRLEADLDVAKVEREVAVADYEHAIQTAFREVADALAILSRLGARLSTQEQRLDAARQAYELVQQRYSGGVASYLEVLDAQRTLYTVQQTWISTRLARQTNFVDLFRALGGDWQQEVDDKKLASVSTTR
ncbi:efflux transporter outer membrane subunit [Pseudomonas sp. S33]|uniref:efflux transporter outer membrane subunit n=1 Tax=unclassified Pseudomonas TaxID=196821 RepID=UPI00190C7469|nr:MULTISPECIES: efflux transporter outer membrane subunit [unclassified Pseudomonas]MBJ9993780.1 efflux transporter outer membrane subunit [Pseudomonas sp. S33]MBK5018111.1 efflux transporter outer membrane subunit [Pseudomonas sp. S68]